MSKSKKKSAPRSTLHEVMRTRHGGAHRPRQEKRQPSKAHRWERHEGER